MWPQWTLLFLMALGLGVSLANHGRPRGPESFWTSIISVAITLTLLYLGGFFKGMF